MVLSFSFTSTGRPPEERPDELRFAYVAWISYAALLTPRIVIAFGKNAQQLKEIYFFGPNTLKAAVACTPLIFLLLVYGHHDARPHSSRKFYIERLTGSVAFDLFDSMDLLEICFLNKEQRQFPDQITDACLAFACINLFLPTLALYELNFNKFNGAVTPLSFKIAYAASFVCLVNVPNLIIRSVLWHKYYTDVSVLLMKNVMCIVLGISDILESIGSERPQKCHKCGRTYSVHHFPQHVQGCTASVVMNL